MSEVLAPVRGEVAAADLLDITGVRQAYHSGDSDLVVLDDVSLSIKEDEMVALLGRSGSGKSTLLRIAAGLLAPTSGKVLWGGKPVLGPCEGVAMVFQSFALFPWLTVLENVLVGLEALGVPPAEGRRRALEAIDLIGLDGFESAYPKELSGGMRQRVGFARALVVHPKLLLMDEPFSALDVLTAENLRGELLELWTSRKMPTRAIFLVTHNIEEAVLLADRVVVLGRNPGRIRADFEVDLPRPRDRKSGHFIELVDHIYMVLTQPNVEHAPPAGPAARAQTAAERGGAAYQMIPHARPGGIAGLLEILIDRGGKDDLYHLADELGMEVGDLLPIIEACTLLDFISVREGDVEITTAGKAFAEADILTRKTLFKEAAVQHVTLLKQIANALRAKADRTLPDDFFSDILDEHFSSDEAERQLQTAIHWGRYAEIFDYDAKTGRLHLTES